MSALGALAMAAAGDRHGVLAQSAAATPAAGAPSRMVPVLTGDGAPAAMQATLGKACEIDVPEVVAVVDAAGNLMAFARMEGTPNTSVDLAIDKAFTAASFHAPTDQLSRAVARDAATVASLLKEPPVTLLPGGVPLVVGKVVIGAIGRSGGTGDQDVQCAQTGVAALSSP